MNIHTPASNFEIDGELFGAERSIIGKCLVSPESISEAAGQIKSTDFEHPFLGKCFEALCRLDREGQKPSVEALVSIFGPDELEPGLTPRAFLDALIKASFFRALMRIDDAVGVLRESAQRRRVAEIGSALYAGSVGIKPVIEIISDATDGLDEIAASFRQGKRLVYDAAGLAPLSTPTPLTNPDADWLAITTVNPTPVFTSAVDLIYMITWDIGLDQSIKSQRKNSGGSAMGLYIAWEFQLEDEISGFTIPWWYSSLDMYVNTP